MTAVGVGVSHPSPFCVSCILFFSAMVFMVVLVAFVCYEPGVMLMFASRDNRHADRLSTACFLGAYIYGMECFAVGPFMGGRGGLG